MAKANDSTSPKISIIVPVYKVEQYLRRCLDSIASQTFTDWECILIDDGSPDKSGAICDEYAEKDSRFRVIHQKNKGVSAARNAGLDAARGEWIGFVDSDDWVEKEFFQISLKEAENYDADCLILGYALSDGKKDFKTILPPAGLLDLSTDIASEWQGPWSKLFKSTVLTTIRFPIGISIAEDMLFTFSIYSSTYKVFGLPLIAYHYFQNPASATHRVSIDKIKQEVCVIQNIENIIKEKNSFKRWERYLFTRKLTAKNRFLVCLKNPRCDLWRKTFSEINSFCVKYSKLSKKIIYILIIFHLDFFVCFILFFHNRRNR